MAKSKTPPSGGRKPNRMMLSRTLFVLIVCGIVAFSALGVQLFRVMILHHNEYESGAIAQQVRRKEVTAMRGTIYDRNGKIVKRVTTDAGEVEDDENDNEGENTNTGDNTGTNTGDNTNQGGGSDNNGGVEEG